MTETPDTPREPDEERGEPSERTGQGPGRTETPYEREEQPGEESQGDAAPGPPETPGQPLPSG